MDLDQPDMTLAPAADDVLPRPMAWAIAAGLAIGAIYMVAFKLSDQPPFVDFLSAWTGGRMANTHPAQLYDFAAVNRAQAWLLGGATHGREFPYPPSALVLYGPLARLPFWPAAVAWTGLTMAAFAWAAARLLPRERLAGVALILLSPAAVWAALSGQITFLIGAMAITSVTQLRRRPLLAGLLLGAAAAVKPTVLLVAPFALLAGGHWRAFWAAGVAAATLIAVSTIAYGPAVWLAWIAAAPRFALHIATDPVFNSSVITPTGLAGLLGLTGWPMMALRVICAGLGVAVAAVVFRRTGAAGPRLTALFGGSLLAAPYAMNYEAALLAPGAVAVLLAAPAGRQRRLALAAFAALALAGLPGLSAGGLMVFLLLTLAWATSEESRAPARIMA